MGEKDKKCCPCCKLCNKGRESEFQKILHLKDTGIVIYKYKISHINEPILDDVFILHNTKDADVSQEAFIPEFEKQKVDCPRCKHLMDRTAKILTSVKSVNRNEIKSICEHCRKKQQPKFPCEKCDKATNQFLTTIQKLIDYPKTKTELKSWIDEQHILKHLFYEKPDIKCEFHSQMFPSDIRLHSELELLPGSIEIETNYETIKRQLDILRKENPELFTKLQQQYPDLFSSRAPEDFHTLQLQLGIIKNEHGKVIEVMQRKHPQLFVSKTEYDRARRQLERFKEDNPELFTNLQAQHPDLFSGGSGIKDFHKLKQQLELIKTQYPNQFGKMQLKHPQLFIPKSEHNKTIRQLDKMKEEFPELFANLLRQYPDVFSVRDIDDVNQIQKQLEFIKTKYPNVYKKTQEKYPLLFVTKSEAEEKPFRHPPKPEYENIKRQLDKFKDANPELFSKLQRQFPDLFKETGGPEDFQKFQQQLLLIKSKFAKEFEKISQKPTEGDTKKYVYESKSETEILTKKQAKELYPGAETRRKFESAKRETTGVAEKDKTRISEKQKGGGVEKAKGGVATEKRESDKKEKAGVEKEKSKGVEKEKPRGVEKEKSKDAEKVKPRGVEKEKSGVTEKEKSRSAEKEKAGGAEKEKAMGAEKVKAGGAEKEKARGAEKEKGGSAEKEKARGAEKEKGGSAEKEKAKSAEKERTGGSEKEKAKGADKGKGAGADKEKAKSVEKDKGVVAEKEKIRGAEKERDGAAEKDKAKGAEKEKAKSAEKEKGAGAEKDKAKGAEKEKVRGAEKEKDGAAEKDKAKGAEKEKAKSAEKEKGARPEKDKAKGAEREKATGAEKGPSVEKEKAKGADKGKGAGAEKEKPKGAEKEKGRGGDKEKVKGVKLTEAEIEKIRAEKEAETEKIRAEKEAETKKRHAEKEKETEKRRAEKEAEKAKREAEKGDYETKTKDATEKTKTGGKGDDALMKEILKQRAGKGSETRISRKAQLQKDEEAKLAKQAETGKMKKGKIGEDKGGIVPDSTDMDKPEKKGKQKADQAIKVTKEVVKVPDINDLNKPGAKKGQTPAQLRVQRELGALARNLTNRGGIDETMSMSKFVDIAKTELDVEAIKKVTKEEIERHREKKGLEFQMATQEIEKTMQEFKMPLFMNTDVNQLQLRSGLYYNESKHQISTKHVVLRRPSYDDVGVLTGVKTTMRRLPKYLSYLNTVPGKPKSDVSSKDAQKFGGQKLIDGEKMIVGNKIVKRKWFDRKKKLYKEPLLFHHCGSLASLDLPETDEEPKQELVKEPESPNDRSGVISYALSDRQFIDKGWTLLPVVKVVRKINVYRMRPSHPEFNWFDYNKNKGIMFYETGEKLADFDDNGRGCWYYRNGRLALDYYETEEVNAQQRFVVYSNGEPDECGRSRPITILASFDYVGNGIVFDHAGKIRLKYNQCEGVVLDKTLGPSTHWKWNDFNDPPVLQQVLVDTQLPFKDPDILNLGDEYEEYVPEKPVDDDMLAIEFDNFLKDQSRKISSKRYKSFPIIMKALRINENFSLRILDQLKVYLTFKDGPNQIKINLGMILDHSEIIDTDTAELGEISNMIERMPAKTDSMEVLQRGVTRAQNIAKNTQERNERIRRMMPAASVENLKSALSRPLRKPLIALTPSLSKTNNKKPSQTNLYYNTRIY